MNMAEYFRLPQSERDDVDRWLRAEDLMRLQITGVEVVTVDRRSVIVWASVSTRRNVYDGLRIRCNVRTPAPAAVGGIGAERSWFRA